MATHRTRIKRTRKGKADTGSTGFRVPTKVDRAKGRANVEASIPRPATSTTDAEHNTYAKERVTSLLKELGRFYEWPALQRRLLEQLDAALANLRALSATLSDCRSLWKSDPAACDEAMRLAQDLDNLLEDERVRHAANRELLRALKAYSKLPSAEKATTKHPRPEWEHLSPAEWVYMLGMPVLPGGQPWEQMFATICILEGLGPTEAAVLAGIFGEEMLEKAPGAPSQSLPEALGYFRQEESAVKAWQKVYSQNRRTVVARAGAPGATDTAAAPSDQPTSPRPPKPGE